MNEFLRTIAVLMLVLFLSGCATTTPGAPAPSGASPAPMAGTTPPAGAVPAPSRWNGPKKRIAVTKFDAAGNFVAQYGGWDIGGGLAAELATELVNTGRFVVLERADLASVLREQQMGLTKIVGQETAAEVGKVLGAQLLVRGSVTEFEQAAGGGGLQLGVGLPGVGGAIGGNTVTGHVAIDLRLIDTTTGQITQSQRAAAKVSQHGVSANILVQKVPNVTLGGTEFQKTPLGQATREAIARAVAIIVERMEKIPWTGRIVDVDGDKGLIYINAGSDANMKPGQVLVVSTVAKELIDPATGTALGVIENRLGEITVESVQEKFSMARPLAPIQVSRGDLLRLK
jgi:curli biogenesis system outer membrane secretion channel CsgG